MRSQPNPFLNLERNPIASSHSINWSLIVPNIKSIFILAALVSCVFTLAIAAACTQPDSTPTPEPTPIPTPFPTSTPLPTETPKPTPLSTPSPEPTPPPTSTPLPTETLTPTPSSTPSPEPTPTPDKDGIISYEPEPATITVEGSTIAFVGSIESETYRDFLFAVRGKEDQITALRVNSGGGITDVGIKIGEWVFDHDIDVIVEELCFSSCANYIFTAGNNKTIEAEAIVGWHGSNHQDEHLARGYGVSLEEFWAREYDENAESWGETPTDFGKDQYVEDIKEHSKDALPREKVFLDNIGVSVNVMVYGFIPGQFDHYMSHERHIRGWTFSIEDMAKFGVDNVTYEGDGEYPSEKAIENFPVAVLNVPTTTIPPAGVPPPGSTPTPEPSATIEPDFQVGADPLAEPHPAEITVDGDTVVISGDLNDNAYIRFRSEIVGREEDISAIRINSKYDDVVQAILIGFWIYDHGVDVVVDELCMSACANYIFTAGKNKFIEDMALVGWFGSPKEVQMEARSLGLSIGEMISRDLGDDPHGTGSPVSDEEREQILNDFVQDVETAIDQERRFLEWTGINEDALLYGFIGIDWDVGYWPMHLFEGWTFSIEDTAKLGIENVTYNGSGEYPSTESIFVNGVTVFEVP